jgi:hypothetical protein
MTGATQTLASPDPRDRDHPLQRASARRAVALHGTAWEDADEYQAIVSALTAEHIPQGPTEERLVEEIAGIMWRKRRLRLAEAAMHRRGLRQDAGFVPGNGEGRPCSP